jgi:hypothetical protein
MGTFNVHQRTNYASPRPSKQMINGFFLLKTNKLHFINYVMFIALFFYKICLFNLITHHAKDVAPHIFHQLQLLLGRHLGIASL